MSGMEIGSWGGVQHAVCHVQWAPYSVQHAVCRVQWALYSVQHAVCSMQCAVCSVSCAVCRPMEGSAPGSEKDHRALDRYR